MSFAFQESRGTVGGAALANDSDPNAAAPADSRQHEVHSFRPSSDGRIQVVAAGGTTVTVQPWFYERATKRWTPYSASFAVTPAAPGNAVGARIDGAPVFLQVVANTLVEQLSWFYS